MPLNAVTENELYLPSGKTYDLQNWYTDGVRQPASATCAWAKRSKVNAIYLFVIH